ncbi:MAG: precorrin-3B C(17)-methyltransferase [Gluconacetobacter diazotrophicus]|nr:precorrin-3B C(17)-methyltransferase [Gluconacetobacter diazotrophicus]
MSAVQPPGSLAIVGLGPGGAGQRTAEVEAALDHATDLVGYAPYLHRVEGRASAIRHGSDNREELARARRALSLAMAGKRVVVVSGGDPGVFAMAAAVFEAIEHGEPAWRGIDVAVLPGISAMLAAAARVGAPLGGDFCAISLSDNLKPWPLVVRRLQAAAGAGFAIALYNPISRSRPWQLRAAFDALRAVLPGTVPVVFAHAVGRACEHGAIHDLHDVDEAAAAANMSTLVIVGAPSTRRIARPNGRPDWVYTPRGVDPDEALP